MTNEDKIALAILLAIPLVLVAGLMLWSYLDAPRIAKEQEAREKYWDGFKLRRWWRESNDDFSIELENGETYRGNLFVWYDAKTAERTFGERDFRLCVMERELRWGRHGDKERRA